MMKTVVLALTFLAVAAFANAKSYNVKLFQPSIVGNTELAPGEYKVEVNESTATIRDGKQSVEASVKVEDSADKFAATSVRYQNGDGKYRIQEIRIGGTKTKIVFN